MVWIKEYNIPGMGCFGISHFSESKRIGDKVVGPGYIGSLGVLTLTDFYDTIEEAEENLKTGIIREINREKDRLMKRKDRINRIEKSLQEGLDKYLVNK